MAAVGVAMPDYDASDAIPLSAALCFVDGEFPIFGTLSIADIHLRSPKGMPAVLTGASGPIDSATRARLHAHLAARLPPAA